MRRAAEFGRRCSLPGRYCDRLYKTTLVVCIVKTGCVGDLNKCPAGFCSGVLPQPTDIAYLVIAGPGDGICFFSIYPSHMIWQRLITFQCLHNFKLV